jgi:hypothetical protein
LHEVVRVAGKAKVLAFLAAMIVALLFVLMDAKPAHAVTLTVNSTADPGTGGCNSTECALR